MSNRRKGGRGVLVRNLVGSIVATAACAVLGSIATDPDSMWYRQLDKPSWQPPPIAFPVVWTLLYADVAITSALVLTSLEKQGRHHEAAAYRRALGVNLTLNAGWCALFFAAHQPTVASVECAVLAISSADLARRAGKVHPAARIALAPYALWCGFATVLSGTIAARN
ncbi:TspO/MBR family protein [Propionibacteriaceae bacterium Y1685]|uniref:TspO/MBR family protein n=1 Tax=Microlunatus sp. Y1700 TaxID=3418487 RepID=UPI003B79B242